MRFNLIVTTFRHAEHYASSELMDILKELGDDNPEIHYSNISGLLLCHTRLEPLRVIRGLYELIDMEPWRIRYILRCIPIEVVVDTSLEAIKDACIRLSGERIKPDESFRITVEKRHASIESAQIIKAVAEHIDRRVDLEHYDWNILIQVIGRSTGISIVKEHDIFSSVKAKRGVSSVQ